MVRRTRKRRGGRKAVPWAGWGKIAPFGHARTLQLRRCGKGKRPSRRNKCFLGPRSRPKSFPICKKGTCKISNKGLYAAYIRARQWGKKKSHYKGKSRPSMKRRVYTTVARRAKSMLRRRGALRGGGTRKHRRGGRRGRR